MTKDLYFLRLFCPLYPSIETIIPLPKHFSSRKKNFSSSLTVFGNNIGHIDIENQTIDERISWWEKSEKTPGQQSILQSLLYMKEHSITSELVGRITTNIIEENVNSNNHSEKKETYEIFNVYYLTLT